MATTYRGGVCPGCLKTYDRQAAVMLKWVCPCGEEMVPLKMTPADFLDWLAVGMDADDGCEDKDEG